VVSTRYLPRTGITLFRTFHCVRCSGRHRAHSARGSDLPVILNRPYGHERLRVRSYDAHADATALNDVSREHTLRLEPQAL
jgi:hypothetical protein